MDGILISIYSVMSNFVAIKFFIYAVIETSHDPSLSKEIIQTVSELRIINTSLLPWWWGSGHYI